MTAAGTGFADLPDSRAAGRAAAEQALERAGGGVPDLVFCFHHGRHDAAEVVAGVREAVGDEVPLVGGSAPGVVTNTAIGYEGHQVGVGVLRDTGESPVVVGAGGLAERGEAPVGADLGHQLAERMAPDADVLFLWSSVRRGMADPEGASLYFGTPLVAGLLGELPGVGTVAGAGTLDGLSVEGSSVISPRGSDRGGAVAVAFADGLRMDTIVLHGCRPAGSYHTITRAEGPLVLEIDGRPALEVIDELLAGTVPRSEYPFSVILGVNRGERFGAFDEESYQTRLCLAIDERHGALVMFEPDLAAGTDIQLMRTSHGFGYVAERVGDLMERLEDRRPVLGLYLDCMGRCALASGTDEEDAVIVRDALGDVPFLGFYSGVEVARVGDAVRPLDVTGVLCVLSE